MERLKRWYTGFKGWFTKPAVMMDLVKLVLITILLLGITLLDETRVKTYTTVPVDAVEHIKAPMIEKKVKFENKAIQVSGDMLIIDRSKMKVTKTVATTNLKNKKKMIGISYALEMNMEHRKGTSAYITFYEDEDSLNITKKYKNLLIEEKKESK